MKKHEWLRLQSSRTQPYELEDITVCIPSAANRYKKRWQWFWPQYVEKTDPITVKNTVISCDPEEGEFFLNLTQGSDVQIITSEVRWIVPKTMAALSGTNTRLFFRLANDIMIVRKGWEKVLLKQFNEEKNLQIIGELQNGISYPESLKKLQRDWGYLRREYPYEATAAEYLHGSRLFAQSALWRAYYERVSNYTLHDHDEIFFTQIARADGIHYTNFRGINLYLGHVGITNKDFTRRYIREHIEPRREELHKAPDKHEFTIIRP